MDVRIALAGNPNSGKTTLFNALTGSNQFVGNWPGVTVEKKEGKLKKHEGVTITDLPGIYSLSPYTLEEVVARNYLLGERPDAILNIIDGTNLERNLYLTTQLTELGIPVVVAINMMDLVKKNGDKINVEELSRQLGCKVVEISALKGTGVMAAAEAAIDAAKNSKTVPQHTFSGSVEHALAHIEEAAVHNMPEEQQRWYAIKIFERDDKVLSSLNIDKGVLEHIENDIKAVETEMDDDAESIITNERYIYIGEVIKACYKKKNHGGLSTSDRIDRIVTNRWLGLPIFAVVMFIVYWVAMVGVGAPATDWANDGLFGDGWHLLGIGSKAYHEQADDYTAATQAVDAFLGLDMEAEDFDADAALAEMKKFKPAGNTATIEVEDEETLAVDEWTAYYDAIPEGADEDTTVPMTYVDAVSYLEKNGFDEPDPADYGIWVPGVPVLVGNALEKADTADWLSGLILDGIVAGVGAVLGFVPQMLVLFLMLAFLEACGYMARIAFVLDRIFRKFGLSGKSFIPMLIGTGCGIPGIMASRTIENERDRRMTIMTTTFIPCGAKVPFIGNDRRRSVWRQRLGFHLRLLHRHGCHHHFRYHAEEDQDVCRRSRSLRYGAARVSLAHSGQCPAFHVGARLVLHQEGRYHHSAFHHLCVVHLPLRLAGRAVRHVGGGSDRALLSWPRSAMPSPGSLHPSAGATGRRPLLLSPVWLRRKTSLVRWAYCTAAAPVLYMMLSRLRSTASPVTASWYSTCCALPASRPSVLSSVR